MVGIQLILEEPAIVAGVAIKTPADARMNRFEAFGADVLLVYIVARVLEIAVIVVLIAKVIPRMNSLEFFIA